MYDVGENPDGVTTVAARVTYSFICFRLLYHVFQIRRVETNERSVGTRNRGSIHRRLSAPFFGLISGHNLGIEVSSPTCCARYNCAHR